MKRKIRGGILFLLFFGITKIQAGEIMEKFEASRLNPEVWVVEKRGKVEIEEGKIHLLGNKLGQTLLCTREKIPNGEYALKFDFYPLSQENDGYPTQKFYVFSPGSILTLWIISPHFVSLPSTLPTSHPRMS